MREAFVGFDSAWADGQPGGICCAVFEDDHLERVCPPATAHFRDAEELVEGCRREADYTLVAIDQPTMVPNEVGMRPVEKVAGALKTGVLPANLGNRFWQAGAPIWAFLDGLHPDENPHRARSALGGLHVIEVFPGLALQALVRTLNPGANGKDLRYDPSNPKFSLDDWRLVTDAVCQQAMDQALWPLAEWAERGNSVGPEPSKTDQDRLDALICLVIARKWRRGDQDTVVLGDWRGHMVTPLSRDGLERIEASARRKNVPVGCGSFDLHDAVLRYFDYKHYDAFEWLGYPAPALGGKTPLAYASTARGVQEVQSLLGRMAHGIPT